ncbi:response regulator transcription factor [Acerihabitans sp. TG2]|uniref:response regulator transcription factor n=1 Tax=Acerihabitans sp. TG2 TaxID=3096008 RepID=UPI002B224406|nr:response regulator transcription factor [Acerihabitans sp. TG2]MEA9392027.1 response regulator transcription factor [Acerihabitans sp. TG2]
MKTTSIKVLLVEDDEVMRLEFETMVASHSKLSLVGSVATLADAWIVLRHTIPDVAIVDLGLRDGDGVDLITSLQQRGYPTAVLVATIFGDEAHVIRAIEAGARGYLLKDTSIEEFSRAVELVHDGGAPLSPQIAKHLLKRLGPAEKLTAAAKAQILTTREIDILKLISQGFTVAESARRLTLSTHTISTHIKNIYSKLAVHNRVAAIIQAKQQGLL